MKNRSLMKWLTLLMVTCMMLSMGVNLIAEEDTQEDVVEELVTVDLAQIQAWALTDNADRDRLFDDLADARTDLVDAEDDVGSGSGDVALKKSYSYDIIEAELELDEALYAIAVNEAELLSEAQSLYFDQQLIKENITLMEMTIAIEQVSLDTLNDKYAMGMVTELAVSEGELRMMNYEMQLQSLAYSYESVLMEINMLINQPIETSYDFVIEAVPDKEYQALLTEEMIEDAVEEDQDLAYLYEELELMAMEIEIYDDLNDDDDYDSTISNLEASYTSQEVLIEETILNIKTQAYVTYNNVLSAKDTLTINQVALKQAELEQYIITEKSEMGDVLETEVADSNYDVASAELSIIEAQVDYLEAIEAYEDIVGEVQ